MYKLLTKRTWSIFWFLTGFSVMYALTNWYPNPHWYPEISGISWGAKMSDFRPLWGRGYPPIPLREKSAKKTAIFGKKTPILALFDPFFEENFPLSKFPLSSFWQVPLLSCPGQLKKHFCTRQRYLTVVQLIPTSSSFALFCVAPGSSLDKANINWKALHVKF